MENKINSIYHLTAALTWYIKALIQYAPDRLRFDCIDALEDFLLNEKLVKNRTELKEFILKAQKDLQWLYEHEVNILTVFDSKYPERFLFLKNPPFILTYFGEIDFSHQCFSIVGSRNPSGASSQWLDTEVSKLLSIKKLCVVSGGARGVDQKAHALALRHQRPTYMLLPSGLARPYPKNIMAWKSAIVELNGAIISQFSPFEDMRKHYFHMRNQIIASFSPSILIVDAKRRSGTMMTANYASSLGTEVLVVPNSPIFEASLGGLDLLFAGADLVRDHEDILELIN
ncbi:MAG: DNA-protecting protein DprA [Bdellovibrionales bacterium]|nr:DNA-protecting protein DprA [Bdellovibrionales bacterium]